jgi:hypothetical protein
MSEDMRHIVSISRKNVHGGMDLAMGHDVVE